MERFKGSCRGLVESIGSQNKREIYACKMSVSGGWWGVLVLVEGEEQAGWRGKGKIGEG